MLCHIMSAASERNFPIWSPSLEYVHRAAGCVHELLMHFSGIKWTKEVWILLCFQYVQWSLFCFFVSNFVRKSTCVHVHESLLFLASAQVLNIWWSCNLFIFLPFLFLLSFRRIYFSHLLNIKPLRVKMSLLKSCSWNWSDRKSQNLKLVKQTKILIFRLGRDKIPNLELGLIGFLIFLLLCFVTLFIKKCQIMTLACPWKFKFVLWFQPGFWFLDFHWLLMLA